jgi:hypothetical protein
MLLLLFNTTHMLSGPPSTGVLMWSKVHGGDSKGREGGSWHMGGGADEQPAASPPEAS